PKIHEVRQQMINLLAPRTRSGCKLRQLLSLAETLLQAHAFVALKLANRGGDFLARVSKRLESPDYAGLLLFKRRGAVLKRLEVFLKLREVRHRAIDLIAAIARDVEELRQLLELSQALLQADLPVSLQHGNFRLDLVSHISQRGESTKDANLFVLQRRKT